MNDKEKYIKLLHSFGFKQSSKDSVYTIVSDEYLVLDDSVYLGAGDGYASFYSWLEFDKDGNYLSYGAAE